MTIYGRKLLNAIQEAYPRGLPSGVDEIWYADTASASSPDGIEFMDFTTDLVKTKYDS